MGFVNKYFNPKIYSNKVISLCLLIFMDIFLNSFTQFNDFGSTNIMKEYQLLNYVKGSGDVAYAILR